MPTKTHTKCSTGVPCNHQIQKPLGEEKYTSGKIEATAHLQVSPPHTHGRLRDVVDHDELEVERPDAVVLGDGEGTQGTVERLKRGPCGFTRCLSKFNSFL